MRTTAKWLWFFGLGATPLAFVACGDDSTTGGGGSGGETTTTTTSTTTSTTTTTTTTSSTGGGGSGGGFTASDACPPADALALAPGDAPVTVNGTTTALMNDFAPYCTTDPDGAGPELPLPAPDAVVQVDISADCTLEVSLTDVGSFDGLLSIRHEACETRVGGDICYNSGTDNEVAREHATAGSHWIVVDGDNGTSGDFALTISCSVPVCGDGVLNPGEQCDYLPVLPNDGCGDPGTGNECQAEGQVAAESCPGTPVVINAGETLHLPSAAPTYNTAGNADDSKGTCMPAGENGGPDETFAVTPAANGTLTITLGEDFNDQPFDCMAMDPGCWANFVYVREAACTNGTEVVCGGYDALGVSEVTVPVTAGMPYFVFVDGLNDQFYAAGPYVLRLELN